MACGPFVVLGTTVLGVRGGRHLLEDGWQGDAEGAADRVDSRAGSSARWDIVTQQHGGAIEVDSQPGEFTEFTIRLPRNGQAAGRSP
jgi:hypothetical protein